MISYIKTELMKEKRSANLKLGIIVPIIFVLFNVAMVSLMGKAQKEKVTYWQLLLIGIHF